MKIFFCTTYLRNITSLIFLFLLLTPISASAIPKRGDLQRRMCKNFFLGMQQKVQNITAPKNVEPQTKDVQIKPSTIDTQQLQVLGDLDEYGRYKLLKVFIYFCCTLAFTGLLATEKFPNYKYPLLTGMALFVTLFAFEGFVTRK